MTEVEELQRRIELAEKIRDAAREASARDLEQRRAFAALVRTANEERDAAISRADLEAAQHAQMRKERDEAVAVVEAGLRWLPSVRTKANHARMPQVELDLYNAISHYRAAKEAAK